MRIVWIDDEINTLDTGVGTLEMLGNHVIPFRTTQEFLKWLDTANESLVDVFFVDLMMRSDDSRLDDIAKQYAGRIKHAIDTGTLLILAIRNKFANKPIIALTIVTNPNLEIFSSDENFRYVLKTSQIQPLLEIADKMLEK